MELSGLGNAERRCQQDLSAVKLTESSPTNTGLEREVRQDVRGHAVASIFALFSPPLESDPISTRRRTMHQLNQRIRGEVLHASSHHSLPQGTLRAVCVTDHQQHAAQVGESPPAGNFVFV